MVCLIRRFRLWLPRNHPLKFRTGWRRMDGELVGGLYGVSLGRMFYGESMFSKKTDSSKIALAHLVFQLKRWNFGMIDCQMNTAHLATLGAREIPRSQFLMRLQELIHYPDIASPWLFEHDLIA